MLSPSLLFSLSIVIIFALNLCIVKALPSAKHVDAGVFEPKQHAERSGQKIAENEHHYSPKTTKIAAKKSVQRNDIDEKAAMRLAESSDEQHHYEKHEADDDGWSRTSAGSSSARSDALAAASPMTSSSSWEVDEVGLPKSDDSDEAKQQHDMDDEISEDDEMNDGEVDEEVPSAMFKRFLRKAEEGDARPTTEKHDHAEVSTHDGNWDGALRKLTLDASHVRGFLDVVLASSPESLAANPIAGYARLLEQLQRRTGLVFRVKLSELRQSRIGIPVTTGLSLKHKNCPPKLLIDKIVEQSCASCSAEQRALFKLDTLYALCCAVVDHSYLLHYHTTYETKHNRRGELAKIKHKKKAYMYLNEVEAAIRHVMNAKLEKWDYAVHQQLQSTGMDSTTIGWIMEHTIAPLIETAEVVVRQKCKNPRNCATLDDEANILLTEEIVKKVKQHAALDKTDERERRNEHLASKHHSPRQPAAHTTKHKHGGRHETTHPPHPHLHPHDNPHNTSDIGTISSPTQRANRRRKRAAATSV